MMSNYAGHALLDGLASEVKANSQFIILKLRLKTRLF